VAELLARGVPALLVPYPLAAGDHQTKNARSVVAAGAALMIPDGELTPARLADHVKTLLDPGRGLSMKKAALDLARPDAAIRIADVVVELASARTGE
jgi:UDP-N-acetylglucosamine--N-acetylmuramyl-(pentapeptide) pyrophosphoryl-undecaprenol N-acetylglucosamine transferase